jgi:type IV pilus assembly protein PilB
MDDMESLLAQLKGLVVVDEFDVLRAVGDYLDLEVVDLDGIEIDRSLLDQVPPRLLRRHQIIPLTRNGDVLRVAMADPYDFRAFDLLRLAFDARIEPVLASRRQIRMIVRQYADQTGTARYGADGFTQLGSGGVPGPL